MPLVQDTARQVPFSDEEERSCRQERRMLCETDNCKELGADSNRTHVLPARAGQPAKQLPHEDISFAAPRPGIQSNLLQAAGVLDAATDEVDEDDPDIDPVIEQVLHPCSQMHYA